MLDAALLRMASLSKYQYLLCVDANMNPQASAAIRKATKSTTSPIVDIGARWGDNPPHPTFYRSGPFWGMSGPGVTRIDTVLANVKAANGVAEWRHC